MATRQKRHWHSAFAKYMEFIATHPHYAGMPHLHKANGEVRWVATCNSHMGQDRWKWWDKKRKKLGMPADGPWISKVARAIHPTGEKPCQVCGKVLKLDYVYPNKRGGMSPGAMSNAPDRLDGYHTYNLCCRGKQDTGRSASNLQRYGEDRRAYENWADGDWKAASWLMKVFQKHGVSPDHVGPISLGFRHRTSFRPLTRAGNSARNNRMTLADVKLLLKEEKEEEVISKHSKLLWDLLKRSVRTDADALVLTKLMREHMHLVLSVFSYIAAQGYKPFLAKHFLSPQYAPYAVEFEGFDPKTGRYKKMVKVLGTKTQYTRNAKRYERISFEALEQYLSKDNRRLKDFEARAIEQRLEKLLHYLKKGDERGALRTLYGIFDVFAQALVEKFSATRSRKKRA